MLLHDKKCDNKVKFYNIDNKGWAYFQPENYNFTLKLALTNQ